jgi:hypothetical protein
MKSPDSRQDHEGPVAGFPRLCPTTWLSLRGRAVLAPLAILAVTTAVVVWNHWRDLAPYNADQAIVGLMAQDILYRNAHPVFFAGSEYAGTLEQHYVAAWFWLLPDTVAVHRAAIALLLVGIVLAIWSLALVLLGPRAALASGLFLALAPQFFFRRGLMSDGPYTPYFLLAAVVLLLVALSERRVMAGGKPTGLLVSIAFLLGLAWWTHPLAMALGLAVAVTLLLGETRRRVSWQDLATSLAAFMAGSLPWWLRNWDSQWASLTNADTGLRSFGKMLVQWQIVAREGVPILIGARAVADPARPASWISIAALSATGLTLLLGLLVINRFGTALARRMTLCAVLFALASAAMGMSSLRISFAEPRFLFPTYFVLALCFGAAVTCASAPPPLRLAIVGAALALHLYSHFNAQPSRAPSQALVRQIEETGVATLYTTYWKAYPITFRSRGRVVAAPFGPSEPTRGRPERKRVDSSSSPAFLLEGSAAMRMNSYLDHKGWRFQSRELEGSTLFFDLPAEAIAYARACGCVPRSPE